MLLDYLFIIKQKKVSRYSLELDCHVSWRISTDGTRAEQMLEVRDQCWQHKIMSDSQKIHIKIEFIKGLHFKLLWTKISYMW